MRRWVGCAALVWLAARNALAVTFAPDAVQLDSAAAEGVALARAGEGYPLRDYLVYQVPDARALRPQDGCVDAVIATTPLERARHEAYLRALQSRPATAPPPVEIASHELTIVVYAHGESAHDEQFTQRFRDARLIVGDRQVTPARSEASEPVDASYPHALTDRRRPVATLTWRFALAGLADDSTPLAWLRFTDATGLEFRIALPLAVLH